MFYSNMFYHLGNEFQQVFRTLIDELKVGRCELEEGEIPKRMKEIMEVLIPET